MPNLMIVRKKRKDRTSLYYVVFDYTCGTSEPRILQVEDNINDARNIARRLARLGVYRLIGLGGPKFIKYTATHTYRVVETIGVDKLEMED